MYYLTVENSFDSAHFLHGYEGKCSNLHGHRWRVVVDVACEELIVEGQQRGMCVDFGDLKKDVKEITDFLIFSQKPLSKSKADKIILFVTQLYTK